MDIENRYGDPSSNLDETVFSSHSANTLGKVLCCSKTANYPHRVEVGDTY